MPRFPGVVQEPTESIAFVLEVQGHRNSRMTTSIDLTSVDREAGMEADLALLEGHRYLDRLTPIDDKALFEFGEILSVKCSHLVRARPLIAAINIDNWPHLLRRILERDPGGQHLIRGACSPVRPIGVPADDGFRARQLGRFVDDGVVE